MQIWERGPQSVESMLGTLCKCVCVCVCVAAYDIGNRILLCSFLSSSNLLIANAGLDAVSYEITCVRKRYSANIKFARYTRRGKAKNMKS